jgi:DedD protein
MKWSFWRRSAPDDAQADPPAERGRAGAQAGADEEAARRRASARRRLIGAAALLLALVIVLPMVLDPAPRPVADSIPIEIPSEKQPFVPRLSLPPVPDPGVPAAAPGGPAADRADAPAKAPDAAAAAGAEPTTAPAVPEKKADERPAKSTTAASTSTEPAKAVADAAASKSKPAPARVDRFYVQAAALGTEAGAREMSERLRKAGFAPFTEKTDTKDGVRYRVRLGPYATRDEAERARARLRAMNINANVVLPERP